MKPYYEADGVTIYHADLRDLSSIPGTACVVTSPPYNVGIGYEDHVDVMAWEDYWELARATSEVVYHSLIDGGRTWVNTAVSVPVEATGGGFHSGRTGKARVLLHVKWAVALEAAGLNLVDQVAWPSVRSNGCAWGSWQSPSAPNLRGDWEAVTIACRGEWERPGPGDGWKDGLGGWPELCSTVWRIQPESRAPDGHPAPFPIELAERCIRLSTWPGEIVLDPFMGSGTTLVAAKRLGRKAMGIELSERYCEIAARRLDQGVLPFGDVA